MTMIKPGDLQRNNIIKIRSNGAWRTVKVKATFETFVIVTNPYTHVGVSCDYGEMMHGARISVNWLENFGWERNDDKKNRIWLSNKKSPITLLALEEKLFQPYISGTEIGEPFQYLHELQNLHRTLSGRQLYSETQLKPILSIE